MFKVSAQPDIVRAHQKDLFYEQLFREEVQELFALSLGGSSARLQPHIQTCASLLYYLLSTGRGARTIGEEYCDILQVDGQGYKPGKIRRIMMVILHTLGPYLMENPRRIGIPRAWSEAIVQYKEAFDQLAKVHLALFYLNGVYYQISKRLSSIRYVRFLQPLDIF
jgi:peroxin-10